MLVAFNEKHSNLKTAVVSIACFNNQIGKFNFYIMSERENV